MDSEQATPKRPLVLASESPRRRALLDRAGLVFDVVPSRIDEGAVPLMEPASYVQALADAKADGIGRRYPEAWVLGADTIVVIDDTILGKPSDFDEARRMLRLLSGQTHRVMTGVAIVCHALGRRHAETVVTEVTFKQLSEAEIDWYIRTGEPFDKAGAYAIQGIGTFCVSRINGSYTNVVGLPVCEVVTYLLQSGVIRYDGNAGGRVNA